VEHLQNVHELKRKYQGMLDTMETECKQTVSNLNSTQAAAKTKLLKALENLARAYKTLSKTHTRLQRRSRTNLNNNHNVTNYSESELSS